MPNPNRLSPGQRLTPLFPFVGEKHPSDALAADGANWSLEITGLVQTPLHFSRQQFLSLPMVEKTWDTHCVTGWTHLAHQWRGVELATLLAQAEPQTNAQFVRFVAFSDRDHDTSLPLDYALSHVLLAHEVDGATLTREHGGPVRSVCEGKYFYKSVKWLRRIELLAQDQCGYWERASSYHNNADPFLEERYESRPLAPEVFERCVRERDFRGVVAIKDAQFARLENADLSGANFSGVAIKGCSLVAVNLSGANCSGANFTLSRLNNSQLQGADLSNCDLEGTDLRGADLSGADLRGAILTMTRFARQHYPALVQGARFSKTSLLAEGVPDKESEFLTDPSHGASIE